MGHFKQTAQCLSALPLVLLLSACGGNNDSDTPVKNTAPIANSDSFSSQTSEAVTLDVIANDVDYEKNSLQISTIVQQPQNGSVTIIENALVYVPNALFKGTDTLIYAVSDGELSDQAEVAITIDLPNVAPEANSDSGTSLDSEVVVIDVLANDSDIHNDALSISGFSVQPQYGSVEVIDNALVYTPMAFATGLDTLTYEVTDGELTSSAKVSITNTQSVTLMGLVTDSPIANATVSINLGESTFSTVSDANGQYSLPVVVSDSSSNLVLTARGAEVNAQQNVELVSYLGSASDIVKLAETNREITKELLKAVNVTHLSTAEFLLVNEKNPTELPVDRSTFKQLVDSLNTVELLELAALIKLLVDNPEYTSTDDQTTFSQFQSTSQNTVAQAVTTYLTQISAIDAEGKPTSAYFEALNNAVAETVSDPETIQSFTAEMLAGKVAALVIGDLREGFVYHSGTPYIFNQDGTGSYYNISFNDLDTSYPITWAVVDGALEITFVNRVYDDWTWHYSSSNIASNFNSEVAQTVMDMGEAGLIPNGNVRATFRLVKTTLTPIAIGETIQVYGETVTERKLEVTEELEFTIPITDTFQSKLFIEPESVYKQMTNADLVGIWAMPLVYEYVTEVFGFPTDVSKGQGEKNEILTVSENGDAAGQFSATNYVISISEGIITLQNDQERFEINPFVKNAQEATALVRYFKDDSLSSIFVKKLAKFDQRSVKQGADFVTQLPEVNLTLINADRERRWEGERLKLTSIFSFLLREDQTMNRLSPQYTEYQVEEEGAENFFRGDYDWTWEQDGNKVIFKLQTEWFVQERVWYVISTDENDRTLVVEHDARLHSNDEGDFDYTYLMIQPRIQIIEKFDLSDYEDAWRATLEQGQLRIE